MWWSRRDRLRRGPLVLLVVAFVVLIGDGVSMEGGGATSENDEKELRGCVYGSTCINVSEPMQVASAEWKYGMKLKVKEMFYFAYGCYMKYAFPADELMPLSCKPRYRGGIQDRGAMDESMGNYSLTLVDTLDTIALFGDYEEFEKAIENVKNHVRFDTDVEVSTFEVNIRMLGGLLSGHLLAKKFKDEGRIKYETPFLLDKAIDLGDRILPAFSTRSGLPNRTINLSKKRIVNGDTNCVACTGTYILEMGLLSRLTNRSMYENAARKAMRAIWTGRSKTTNLIGSLINVDKGTYADRLGGIGAGSDSYYEYLAKGYVAFGDNEYNKRFVAHYQALMMHNQVFDGVFFEVDMYNPSKNMRPNADALQAFWPGLQVLMGDVKNAEITYEKFQRVLRMYGFLPESYEIDGKARWVGSPLRPELIESTYALYEATGDSKYLESARWILEQIELFARVPCGFAAILDVRNLLLEDRFDSYTLSETFKYLYLLFAEKSTLPVDLDQYVFTTEAHLVPIGLKPAASTDLTLDEITGPNKIKRKGWQSNIDYTCLLKSRNIWWIPRNKTDNVCTNDQRYDLSYHKFDFASPDWKSFFEKSGVILTKDDKDNVHLELSQEHAHTQSDYLAGEQFLQQLNKYQAQKLVLGQRSRDTEPPFDPVDIGLVSAVTPPAWSVQASAAKFGGVDGGMGVLVILWPETACHPLPPGSMEGAIVVVMRGGCSFESKASRVEEAGGLGLIVVQSETKHKNKYLTMIADANINRKPVTIPCVFVSQEDGEVLRKTSQDLPQILVKITPQKTKYRVSSSDN